MRLLFVYNFIKERYKKIMLKIKCKTSKKGTTYLVLCYELDSYDIYLNMQEPTIIQFARAVGLSPVEVYSLKPGESLDINI